MIVDCFTHVWESQSQLGRVAGAGGQLEAMLSVNGEVLPAGQGRHRIASEPVDVTIVLGFKSHWLDADLNNDAVAAYVRTEPDRMIGFAGIDPSQPKEAIEDLDHAQHELKMAGVSVAPAAQDFHPSDSQAMRVYAEVAQRGLPMVFHPGLQMVTATKMIYAQPMLLDEVAREFPSLKIVIAQMGHPWMYETIVLLAKHENVFAEISGIVRQPWQAYQALLTAHQYGVIPKLLFGSGFPFSTPAQSIEELYSISRLVQGTNLPGVPRESLRSIVERDALTLLGIANPRPAGLREPEEALVSDDEGEGP